MDTRKAKMGEPSWSFNEGDVIAKRYVLVQEIGRGGMGCVYEAFDRKLERDVAIKFLDPGLADDAEAVTRFQREALAAGKIGHENICDVRDRGETKAGVPYIVMEHLVGCSLHSIFVREDTVEPIRLGRLTLQYLSALHAAHSKGIVHRDLKPENIFVTKTVADEEKPKLLDFGISKFLAESIGPRVTKTGIAMGTPFYMSPEQARGKKDIDHRTDLWSVGVILYEGLTGKLPFEGDNYNEVIVNIITDDLVEPTVYNPSIPPEIEKVVLRALARDPSDRYQSANEFGEALETALGADHALSLIPKPLFLKSGSAQAVRDSHPDDSDVAVQPTLRASDGVDDATPSVRDFGALRSPDAP